MGDTVQGRSSAKSIDEYIAEFPPETQAVLREIRALIRECAPDAAETISYAIPTFDLNGKHLVHFGGYQRHIGFYPTASGIEAFKDELKSYKASTGAVQFPLGKPLPVDLIRRIVEFRVRESTSKAANSEQRASAAAAGAIRVGGPRRCALNERLAPQAAVQNVFRLS